MALIVDTSVLLSALDKGDKHHARSAGLIRESHEDLLVPTLTLTELDHMCGKEGLGEAFLGFLEDVESGAWRLEHPTAADLHRARELQRQYTDLAIGVVDATIVALCERLGEDKLATLDRRHFATVRPNHVKALTLLP